MRQGTSRPGPRNTNDSKIACFRRAAGLTQGQLAEMIGVVPSQIGNWENGLRKPKYDALKKISEALNIDINELL